MSFSVVSVARPGLCLDGVSPRDPASRVALAPGFERCLVEVSSPWLPHQRKGDVAIVDRPITEA